MLQLLIELAYLISIFLFVIATLTLVVLLWWLQKHRFWAVVTRLEELNDRVFYWCMDRLMGCEGRNGTD